MTPLIAVGDQLALPGSDLSGLGTLVLIAGGVLLTAFALCFTPDNWDVKWWHRVVAIVLMAAVFVLLGVSPSDSAPRPEHAVSATDRGDGTYMAHMDDGDEIVYTVDADTDTITVTEVTHAVLVLSDETRTTMPGDRVASQLSGVDATVVESTGDTITVRAADGTKRTFRVEYESRWPSESRRFHGWEHKTHAWLYYETESS